MKEKEKDVRDLLECASGAPPFFLSGKGAFGSVWYCMEDAFSRFAIKVVETSGTDDWKHEFESVKLYLSKVKPHPNLIQVYVLEERDECFFYLIDIADSMIDEAAYFPATLDTYVAWDPIDNQELIDIFEQLLDGLDALHAARLVHRDIKPENIIMVDGIPKFSDIGLVASALEPYRVAGTEDFIPPELLGRTKKITPRSGYEADIYALGKTLYCLFSGSSANSFPIIGTDKLATPEGKIINRTINAVCHPSYARRLKTSDEFRKALRGIPVKPHR
ncbi:MAG: protein kinase [Lentisphaeria bacterium]|nr:protein kinase [Lentisphaeria bacterium]